MSELTSITHFTFHDGGLEDFRRLFPRCREVVRAEDTGTLQYEAYVSEDGAEAVILERYRDTDAVAEHMAHIGDDLMAQVMATGSVHRMALGRPTDELRAMAEQGGVRLLGLVG